MVETLDWRLIVIYQHGQTVAFRKEGKLLEGKFVGSIRLLNGKTAHGVDVKGEVYFFTSPLVWRQGRETGRYAEGRCARQRNVSVNQQRPVDG
jgi:hypothetical protein